MISGAQTQIALERVLEGLGSEVEEFAECASHWVTRFSLGGVKVSCDLRNIESHDDVASQVHGAIQRTIGTFRTGATEHTPPRSQLVNTKAADALEAAYNAATVKASKPAEKPQEKPQEKGK